MFLVKNEKTKKMLISIMIYQPHPTIFTIPLHSNEIERTIWSISREEEKRETTKN